MSYVPHTDGERGEMLAAIGVARVEDLFLDIPERVRFPQINLPQPLSELDNARNMRAIAARNLDFDPSCSFLGAGTYHHFRPAIVDYVISRGEFYTSYTQYQP
ncbi:MAG: glycine dehydrogenase, partial [Alphaproteobacteria bacterium]